MAISVSAWPERSSLRPGGRSRIRVAVELVASGAPVEGTRARAACALAIDVSSSMSGPPLAHVIASIDRLVSLVGPDDALGAVTFAADARVIAPVARMDEAARRSFRARIAGLCIEGWTHIERGLHAAADLLDRVTDVDRRCIVLLSDGAPTRGTTTPDGLSAIARSLRPRITVSTLGYGAHHDEDILSAIADAGGGRYQLIQDPTLAQRELAVALGAQGDTVASDVVLGFGPASGVELAGVSGRRALRYGQGGVSTDLSDMIDGASQVIAFELDVDGVSHRGVLGTFTVTSRDASGAPGTTSVDVEIDLRSEEGTLVPHAHALVLVARSEDVRREAREQADRGQFAGAVAILRCAIAEIEASPAFVVDDGSRLAEVHASLVDEANAFARRPDAGSYAMMRKHMTSVRLDASAAPPSRRPGPRSSVFMEKTAGATPDARLVFTGGPDAGKIVPIGLAVTFGRTVSADVVLPHPSVSRRHAEIFTLEGDHYLCDLGSTNPTRVNGARLGSSPRTLHDGDLIAIGDVLLRYLRK